jgi:predicted type IV restriction endonuclease
VNKSAKVVLKDIHIKQAVDYAANEGIEWVVLTNGAMWRVYKVHFGQPIEKILVCEVDLIALSPKSWPVPGFVDTRLSESSPLFELHRA